MCRVGSPGSNFSGTYSSDAIFLLKHVTRSGAEDLEYGKCSDQGRGLKPAGASGASSPGFEARVTYFIIPVCLCQDCLVCKRG